VGAIVAADYRISLSTRAQATYVSDLQHSVLDAGCRTRTVIRATCPSEILLVRRMAESGDDGLSLS